MGMSSIYGGGPPAVTAIGVNFDPNSSIDGDGSREGRRNGAATDTSFSPDSLVRASANSIIALLVEIQSRTTADVFDQSAQSGADIAATQVLTMVQNAVTQLKGAKQVFKTALEAASQQKDATQDQAIQDLVSGIAQGAAVIGMAYTSFKCDSDINALSKSDDEESLGDDDEHDEVGVNVKLQKDDEESSANLLTSSEKDEESAATKANDAHKSHGVKIHAKTEEQAEREKAERRSNADRIWQKADRRIQLINALSSAIVDFTKSGSEFAMASKQQNASTDQALATFLGAMISSMAQECEATLQILQKVADSIQTLSSGTQQTTAQTVSSAIDALH